MPDLLDVRFHDRLRFPQLSRRQPRVSRQADLRCEPELGFSVRMSDMDMDAFLLSREEEPAELTIANDCEGHVMDCSEARDNKPRRAMFASSINALPQPLSFPKSRGMDLDGDDLLRC